MSHPIHLNRRGATMAIALGVLLAMPVAGAAEGAWQAVVDAPGLTDEERLGARFLAQHLDFDRYQALDAATRRHLLGYAAKHSDGNPPLVLCWSKGSPPEVVEAYRLVEQAGVEVKRDNQRPAGIGTAFQVDLSRHWGRTASNGSGQQAQGQPVTLTWSVVPDGTIIPGGQVNGEPTNDPSNLRAWLAGIYGGDPAGAPEDQPWFPIFETIFASMASQSGLRYVYEPNDDGVKLADDSTAWGVIGVRGDVRISGHRLDGNSNVLAYNFFPDWSDMVIDTDDNFYNDTSQNSLRMRNVLEHEHGHGIGLYHCCPVDNTKLMEPFINLGFTGIQFDDIYSMQRFYGDTREVHGFERDNDTIAKATPLAVVVNELYVDEWLGIDDNADVDYYRFNSPAGALLSVRVLPSTLSYLEGPQNNITGNCTAGTAFDSATLQDLGLELIASDQTTVLESAAAEPSGLAEEISLVPLFSAGDYYLRVTGSGADFNQLYRLEIDLGTPAVAMKATAVTLVEELFQGANGAADPGETVKLDIELTNLGQESATNVQAHLVLPPGSQGFDVDEDYGTMASGGATTRGFIFAAAGDCGELITLQLEVTADGDYAATIPLKLRLGEEQVFFAQNFDASANLPAGWASSKVQKGSGWSVVNDNSYSAPNAVFAADPSGGGSSTLTSPTVLAGESPGSLSFRHYYNTEAGWDGGVLEIQINGGGWQDILAAGGSFAYGGYNLAAAGINNPLAGRSAWSGSSGQFIETLANLPPAAANQSVAFRWIMGQDNRVGAVGWWIDNVVYRNYVCDDSGAALVLDSPDDVTTESAGAADPAEVRVTALLPVPVDMPVALNSAGSADATDDFGGIGGLVLTTGNSTVSAVLQAVPDGLAEGDELLTITSPDAAGSVDVTVHDSPYGAFITMLGGSGDVLPEQDFDGDGSMNVEEMIFGTDAASAGSKPQYPLVPQAGNYALMVPLDSLPDGVAVDAERSLDLDFWTTEGVLRFSDRFELPGGDPGGFLRLLYSVPEYDAP